MVLPMKDYTNLKYTVTYSDEQLLAGIQGDDPLLRNKVLRQLYLDPVVLAKVTQFLEFYGKTQSQLDDVIQESVILLDEAIREGRFSYNSSVRTFLIGICKNVARAKGKKINQLSLSFAPADLPDIDVMQDSPEDIFIVVEMEQRDVLIQQLLEQILSQLTSNCKEVIRGYYFLSQSLAEIATQKGLANAKQAKKAAWRCREQLRKKIQGDSQLAKLINIAS